MTAETQNSEQDPSLGHRLKEKGISLAIAVGSNRWAVGLLNNRLTSWFTYKLIGVRKEFPELNPFAAAFMEIGAIAHRVKHHSVIEGYPLPKKGAAILTGNHTAESDAYEACLAGRKVHRLIRTVVKKSLVVEGAEESDEYLESIGDKKDPLGFKPIKAFTMLGIGVIPILRDNASDKRAMASACTKALRNGELLGVFLQASRDEEGLLRNLQEGAALFASTKSFRDTPVHLFAFSEEHAIALEPFTYNQVKNADYGRDLTLAEFTIYMADRLAAALPQHVKDDWKTRRYQEFVRLQEQREKETKKAA